MDVHIDLPGPLDFGQFLICQFPDCFDLFVAVRESCDCCWQVKATLCRIGYVGIIRSDWDHLLLLCFHVQKKHLQRDAFSIIFLFLKTVVGQSKAIAQKIL